MKHEINLKNIKAYISGNTHLMIAELGLAEPHIIEQVAYRESKCPNCAAAGKCKNCGCKLPGRWFVKASCNEGTITPDLMDKVLWEKYKKDNNLNFSI